MIVSQIRATRFRSLRSTSLALGRLNVLIGANASGKSNLIAALDFLAEGVTTAKWHLEAWFFADEASLRSCLGKALGNVDPSHPDAIVNRKLHLKTLLDEPYTARVAGEIARGVDGRRGTAKPKLSALRNGGGETLPT